MNESVPSKWVLTVIVMSLPIGDGLTKIKSIKYQHIQRNTA